MVYLVFWLFFLECNRIKRNKKYPPPPVKQCLVRVKESFSSIDLTYVGEVGAKSWAIFDPSDPQKKALWKLESSTTFDLLPEIYLP